MFHGRIRGLKFKPRHPYLRRIINAHRVHHATATRGGAVSFSFLWAPRFYDPSNEEAINAQLREIREMQRAIRKGGEAADTVPGRRSE
jgi:beta-carotene 3-hydroxylase